MSKRCRPEYPELPSQRDDRQHRYIYLSISLLLGRKDGIITCAVRACERDKKYICVNDDVERNGAARSALRRQELGLGWGRQEGLDRIGSGER